MGANRHRGWLAGLTALALGAALVPSAGAESGLGSGSYAITVKNQCEVAVEYAVTAGESSGTVTLPGEGVLTLRGDRGEAYSVTWLGGAEMTCTVPEETTKSGTFGQAAAGYDGFDGYDGVAYTTDAVSNEALYCAHFHYTLPVDFYYVADSVTPFYSDRSGLTGYPYWNEQTGEKFGGVFTSRSSARAQALASQGIDPSETDRYTHITVDGQREGYLWTLWKAAPYLAFSSEVAENFTLTVVNDCAGAVNYEVTIGETSRTVTVAANGAAEFQAAEGTPYSVTWLGGADGQYAYTAPAVKSYTGVFGQDCRNCYYVDGARYDGAVADSVTFQNYTVSAGVLYAVDTLKTFDRTEKSYGLITKFTYTNVNDAAESYSSTTSAACARENLMKSHSGYQMVTDGSDMGYAWVFKPVSTGVETRVGNQTLAFSAAALENETTGTFQVAALNVDGMPQSVSVAGVYDLKLNEDGPGAEGSVSIGRYIEQSGIDLLALSEDFNFFQEIGANAPSYAAMTQRERIPTYVSLLDLNNSLFPFDTDGLNLMYKQGITVRGESWTAWDEHYSPSKDYVVIQVPQENGADGMIDKGYRFYQAQLAPGVEVDVYILHMDAESDQADIDARSSQLRQLAAAINANENGNPILVLGDTNCRYTRDSIEADLVDAAGLTDAWVELIRDGDYPERGTHDIWTSTEGYQKGEIVDKILYKNVEGSSVAIQAVEYLVDHEGYQDEGGAIGDHDPVIVTFQYTIHAN